MLKNKDYHIFIVLLLSSIVYFIGNTWLSITDPVETNYALTAKEMVLNHNYLSPQIFGQIIRFKMSNMSKIRRKKAWLMDLK